MNLYEQQRQNRRRTWLVMAGFVLLLAVMGGSLDFVFIGNGVSALPIMTLCALGVGSAQAWWGLRHGDVSVLRSSQAQPLEAQLAAASTDDDRFRYRQLQNVVEEMAIAAGIPVPKVYVIPDKDPNAFATGPDPAHASIAVTDGLMRTLSREEMQGVIAHEMSHIRNLDIRLMTVVAALIGAILLLADWSTRIMRFGGGGGRRGGKDKGGGGLGLLAVAIWLLAIILAPILGRMLALAVSRRREYLADATAAELTRNPLSLAGALEKIEDAVDPTPSIKRGTAHLCIADPQGIGTGKHDGWWADLWATHPPMAKRIQALKGMAYTN
jgi:heat shock protein HtpX